MNFDVLSEKLSIMIVEIKERIKDERKTAHERTFCFYVPNLGLSKFAGSQKR